MNDIKLILNDLNINLLYGKEGRDLSTYKIGGNLENLAIVENEKKLCQLLKVLKREKIDFFILGNGSNVLFHDGKIEKLCVKLSDDFSFIEKIDDDMFSCGASTMMPKISNTFLQESLSGFEFACGLPATLGGTIKMHAGCHGQKISDALESITICTGNGEVKEIEKNNLKMQIKNIEIEKGAVITRAKFRLKPCKKEDIKKQMEENTEFRKRTQPLSYPSCGCVFKNPSSEGFEDLIKELNVASLPAGLLLDKCGLKGTKKGGAVYSTMHANWILNESKNALFDDVDYLIKLGQEKVFSTFGVKLETEVVIL